MEPETIQNEKEISLESLSVRIQELEDSLVGLNPRNFAGIRSSDLQRATVANLFGDGSDGDVEITGTTTLTRDMYYKNLSIANGGILNPNGYRIFVKETLIIKSGGYIKRNGNNGGNGSVPNGGSGGAALAAGSLPAAESGKSGGNGGSAEVSNDGQPGVDGGNVVKSLGSAGSGGGGGGASYYSGGAGGNGGSQTGTVLNVPKNYISAFLLIDAIPSVVSLLGSAGSGGGGGGGSRASSNGGGGGGSGSAGGFIAIFAQRIINDQEEGIQGKGGKGGNGGNGATDGTNGAGGGGGGAGGAGGVILIVYGEMTGGGTIVTTGGAKGDKGLKGAGAYGQDGVDGTAGLDGNVFLIQLKAG